MTERSMRLPFLSVGSFYPTPYPHKSPSQPAQASGISAALPPPATAKYGLYSTNLLHANNSESEKNALYSSPASDQRDPWARTQPLPDITPKAKLSKAIVKKAPGKSFAMRSAQRPETALSEFDTSDTTATTTTSVEPKVMLPFQPIVGQTPRRMEIERRKRIYATQDITGLLLDRGINVGSVNNFADQNEAVFLPLELYDDESFEERSASEWMKLGANDSIFQLGSSSENNSFCNISATALLNGRWIACTVLNIEEQTNMLLVRFKDEENKSFKEALLHRIYVLFNAENPFNFADRFASACKARAHTLGYLKYNFFIDSMPSDYSIHLSRQQFEKIHKRCGKMIQSFDFEPSFIRNLNEEIDYSFVRSQNKMIFDAEICNEKLYGHLQLSKVPAQIEVFDHSAQRKEFTFASLLTKIEVVRIMCKTFNECNRIAESSVFFTTGSKPVKLDEFEQQQLQSLNNMKAHLRDIWILNITGYIKNGLKDMGKGWFNLKETNMEIYEMSKLKRFMCVARFAMQDALRFLMENSLSEFIKLLAGTVIQKVIVQDTNSITFQPRDHDDPFRLLFAGLKVVPRRPLFNIDLTVKQGKIIHNLDPNSLTSVLQSLLEKSLLVPSSLPQVEPLIVDEIFWASRHCLEIMTSSDDFYTEMLSKISIIIREAYYPLQEFIEKLNKYHKRLCLEYSSFLQEYDADGKTLDDIEADIHAYAQELDTIDREVPSSASVGLFLVHCESVRNALKKDISRWVLEALSRKASRKSMSISTSFNNIFKRLKERPSSIEELVQLREYLKSIPNLVREQESSIQDVLSQFELLEKYKCELSNDDFRAKWTVFGWPQKINDLVIATEEKLKQDETTFLKSLQSDQELFHDRTRQLSLAINDFANKTDISRINEVIVDVKKMTDELKECQQLVQLFNSRERLFNLEPTHFEQVNQLIKDFEPYRSVWLTASDWIKWRQEWMNGSFFALHAEDVERNLMNAWRTMFKSVKSFKQLPGYYSLTTQLKDEMENFKPYIPLIHSLRNPGMRDRHWTRLSNDLGIGLFPDEKTTLKSLLNLNLLERLDVIAKIGDLASKEYAIESSLENMEREWKNITMDLVPHQSGTYIAKISDETMRLLDDHVVMTQSMGFSQYKKPFEDRIATWDLNLRMIQETFDALLTCQKTWLYLEPIFCSESAEDIGKHMPSEKKKFLTVDRTWKRIMAQAKSVDNTLEFCSDVKLLDALKDSNKLLESISKGLSSYLETKRIAFPRLFFLSDDELLQLLSQAKDPRAIQGHLRKCFENIAKLGFCDQNTADSMQGLDAEVIDFADPLVLEGNVENWLLKIEDAMKKGMKKVLKDALDSYSADSRAAWVLKWPGQVIITGCQTIWVKEVTEAIQQGTLKNLLQKLGTQIEDLVEIVRGELSPLQRRSIGDLIIIDVHAKDIVENLKNSYVSQLNDFMWVRQLRHYWENDDVIVKIVNASFNYAYEYIGNTGRLVMTPLTDRCYLTLTMALHLNLGGASIGPAGTGKTETVKDLSKTLGKQCIVYNCSDQLDYLAMAKFFKGLAGTGAWICFDEFNRINIEVLSVVAQQVTSIQNAVSAGLTSFVFEGASMKINSAPGNCAVFVTMNPGYAGRSELPDNLKVLFRPISMMVPNYTQIAEISLFSFGFSSARNLAQKITAAFQLASQQLSKQDHYDFGMRAVKTVIRSAGNLKRQFVTRNTREDAIVLRALLDCNLPKFLPDDLILFNGIVTDLFPGVENLAASYDELSQALATACKSLSLQPTEYFLKKCLQLFETTEIRNGIMLVGPAGGAKTSTYRTLAKAHQLLQGTASLRGIPYENVQISTLNPKAISLGQLYGEFDAQTHEWTDGIVPYFVRTGVENSSRDKKWYIFDGPVSADWVESMNTVLDENKKLCLSSGEIIKLSESQKLIFEVDNLSFASPATVSRCGMVYMDPTALGTNALVDSWLQSNFDWLHPEMKQKLNEKASKYFREDSLIGCMIDISLHELKFVYHTTKNTLYSSFFRLLEALLRQTKLPNDISSDRIDSIIHNCFAFAFIWSVGNLCLQESRGAFDVHLRKSFQDFSFFCNLPKSGSVFDCVYDIDKEEWIPWSVETPQLSRLSTGSEVIIPTIEMVQVSHILDLLLKNDRQVLCVGSTGTGKSMTISQKLLKGLPSHFHSATTNFSARTKASQTQEYIDSKLEKRRKGVYGPPVGQKMIIFVDDVNMPSIDSSGAQPALELLRQWLDHRGWYDKKYVGRFMELVDITLVTAMAPTGGGRNEVSHRFMRHFNLLHFPDISITSLEHIFQTLLKSFLMRISSEVEKHSLNVVKASINLFSSIKNELLPTPSKIHYTFNMRDLSKVLKGMLMAEPKAITRENDLFRLWIHESMRVFGDRLVDKPDRAWLNQKLKDLLMSHFNVSWNDVVKCEPLIYGDFLASNGDSRSYQEVVDMKRLVKVIDEYLDDLNSTSDKPLKLSIFLEAVEHISRICRIIRQPGGHALLLGVGGGGRQSLARLGAFIEDIPLIQVELTRGYGFHDWREDMKRILYKTGIEGMPLVFLFADTQVISEQCFEDINSLLNSAEIPGLYSNEEYEQLCNLLKPTINDLGLILNKENVLSVFTQRIKHNLRIILCLSPVGEDYRLRLRMFPSIVNCCSIDWFSVWPEEALKSVAATSVAEINDLGSEAIIDGFIHQCVFMHENVREKCEAFRTEHNRHVYVTPKSFLELLNMCSKVFDRKKSEIQALRRRTAIGLDKLLNTTKEVEILQEELEAMQPMLLQTTEETEMTMKKIASDKERAEEIREIIVKEELEASKKAEQTKIIAEDAKQDLDEALPALDAALESLKCLTKNDVIEVRSMQRPPDGVKLVVEAVCIMKGVKPKKPENDKTSKKNEDYWEAGKSLLADPAKFLESLLNFDRDNIPDGVIQKIKPYIDSPDFQPAAISRVSKAATSICQWVRAMEKYYHVSQAVAPKRERLKEAQDALEATIRNLNDLKKKMKDAEVNIKEMEKKHAESMAKKEELGRKVEECNIKLSRAKKLIAGLSNERSRWGTTINELDAALRHLPGDVLLASAALVYFGPFTTHYRAELMKSWKENLTCLNLPFTKEASLIEIMGDNLRLRQWELNGLPKDNLSRENAIILHESNRWSLFIDPQSQANKWLRNTFKEANFDVIKPSDKDFLRLLENCVRFGKICLLEDVGPKLDPSLSQLLSRQMNRQGATAVVRLGDSLIPVHEDFRLYMTTKISNPKFSPELNATLTIINFTLAPVGLEDQLLALVVANERPDLEEAKNNLMMTNAQMKKELKEIEDRILYLLSSVQGSPIEDERLIETLAASKQTSEEISSKVKATEKTEYEIDETRGKYIPVAKRARILFFCVTELSLIDPMYQYSLPWFMAIFGMSIAQSEKADVIDRRIQFLNEHFTFALYANVCRGLFENHKQLFAFMLAAKINMENNLVTGDEWRFLLAGSNSEKRLPNPAPDWLSSRAWMDLIGLCSLPAFQPLEEDLRQHIIDFQYLNNSQQPYLEELPARWVHLTHFQKLLLIKCFRPDTLLSAIVNFVNITLGERFVEPQASDISVVFKESQPFSPIILILSSGAAEEMRFSKKMISISLGQGQGQRAENAIHEAMERGYWALLQNCHLAPSWMSSLERIVDSFNPERISRDFRLWLTSLPSESFPISVLQSGLKLTVEPPTGIKGNVQKIYLNYTDEYFKDCRKESQFKKFLFSLSLFHALVQERRKFGPIGWNIPYEFTDSDFQISERQLKMFLEEYDEVPLQVLKHITGHINYGGRITDDWDRRLVMTILDDFYNLNILKDNHQFFEDQTYVSIAADDIAKYRQYIRSLPNSESAIIFGMHENANIAYVQKETQAMFESLLRLLPKTKDSALSVKEEQLYDLIDSLLSRLPNNIIVASVTKNHPQTYDDCMTTIIYQETFRYNSLLDLIRESLFLAQKAIKGQIVMSNSIEAICDSISLNSVPAQWNAKSYPSLKPLSSWISDLTSRIDFIYNWVEKGSPAVYWFSGLFFPQAFLTGTLQNFARKHSVAVDMLSLECKIQEGRPEDVKQKAADGCYIRGLYLEGARWDASKKVLAESKYRELYSEMPVMLLVPTQNRSKDTKNYVCPVYRTLSRAGVLSTTGHSTNFIVSLEIPSNQPQSHWIKRGVAMVCSLNF